MSRANGDCREIRSNYCVSLSNRSEHPAQTRYCAGHVPPVFARTDAVIYRSREIQSDIPAVSRRRWPGHAAIMVAVFECQPGKVNHFSSGRGGVNAHRRSGEDDRNLDWKDETQRAGWITMPLSLGATGTTGSIAVRVPRIGTTPPRTRTTTSGLAASVTAWQYSLGDCYGFTGRPALCGQPVCPPLGNTFQGPQPCLVTTAKSQSERQGGIS